MRSFNNININGGNGCCHFNSESCDGSHCKAYNLYYGEILVGSFGCQPAIFFYLVQREAAKKGIYLKGDVRKQLHDA